MPRRSWRKLFSRGGIPGVEENKMIDDWLVHPGASCVSGTVHITLYVLMYFSFQP